MDALNRCGWMDALSRVGCMDAISRGEWWMHSVEVNGWMH